MIALPQVVRLGAYGVCVDERRRLLLCRISPSVAAGGFWTLPGGGVQFGEDPVAAVLRELGEETGLTGSVGEVISVSSRVLEKRDWANGGDVHSVAIVFRVAVEPGEIRPEVGGTSDACEWLTRDAAEALPLWPLGREGFRIAFGE